MPSTFLTLQIGYSALQDSTLGVQTTGHNIANANTPGYARETVDSETANSLPDLTDHQTFLGQGVNGRSQLRVNSPAADDQFRGNNSQQSYWDTKSSEINNVAQVFNEPSGTTLRNSIDSFFSSWNQLSQSPSDSGARAAVYQASVSVAQAFQTTSNALSDDFTRYQNELSASGQDFNSILGNIADLNQQIMRATAQSQASGSNAKFPAPNDLLDQRDAYLDELSKYAKIEVTQNVDGTVTVAADVKSGVAAGGANHQIVLVNGNSTTPAATVDYSIPSTGTSSATSVKVQDLLDQTGQLSALYDMTQYISNNDGKSGVLDKLNSLASEFTGQVNNQFMMGYGLNGYQPMFPNELFQLTTSTSSSGVTTSDVQANPFYGQNLNDLPAASNPTTGGANSTDGTNASKIADLMTTYEQSGSVSYAGIVTQLGIDGQDANDKDKTFSALATQSSQFRQSISGVNINEEMKNMIQYQQAYGAASKLISVFNDMLSTLINAV